MYENFAEVTLSPDVIKTFNKVWKNRQMGLYIDTDLTGPHLIKEADYVELLKYAKMWSERTGRFTTMKFLPYNEIEDNVNEMRKQAISL